VRGGVCQPLGSFVCMNGGENTCHYDGNGTLVGQPECKCKQGFTGTWCELQANVLQKGIEPRSSASNITQEKVKIAKETSKNASIENSSKPLTESIPEEDQTEKKLTTTKDEVQETSSTESSSTTEIPTTLDATDPSKKSETLDETTKPVSDAVTTISTKLQSSSEIGKPDKFGVRAIHSDVFNSGKRIEHFGSEEGLQSFKDY